MRIISGELRGRRLKSPKRKRGPGRVRPLTGQAKEALFNILRNDIADCDVLDVFAGTGAVGMEALSRGAQFAIFVEKDHHAVAAIRANLKSAGLEKRADVFALDARRALNLLGNRKAQFDFIFLGAPYDDPVIVEAIELVASKNLIRPKGHVVAEHRKTHTLAPVYGALRLQQDRRYGETVLSFYKVQKNDEIGADSKEGSAAE